METVFIFTSFKGPDWGLILTCLPQVSWYQMLLSHRQFLSIQFLHMNGDLKLKREQ